MSQSNGRSGSIINVARRVNLHVRLQGRSNQRYALLFRDYLRAHPRAAAAYGQAKTALAHYRADDIEAYYGVKDPVDEQLQDSRTIMDDISRMWFKVLQNGLPP